MNEVFIGTALSLTAPAGTTNVLVVHEWGDLEIAFASQAAGSYTPTLNSVGVYYIYFVNNLTFSPVVTTIGNMNSNQGFINHPIVQTIGSQVIVQIINNFNTTLPVSGTYTATVLQRNSVEIVPQLVNASDFFSQYPNLDNDNNEGNFTFVERTLRRYVQRHCQQSFGPYIYKSRVIQGEGKDDLPLPYPILNLVDVADNYGNDLTIYVDIDFISPWFLHHRPDTFFLDASVDYIWIDRKADVSFRGTEFFSRKLNYTVIADWGYYDVPIDVVEATKLLIVDTFTGNSALIRSGIDQAQLGDYSYKVSPSASGSTGNLIADELLSNYVLMNIYLA